MPANCCTGPFPALSSRAAASAKKDARAQRLVHTQVVVGAVKPTTRHRRLQQVFISEFLPRQAELAARSCGAGLDPMGRHPFGVCLVSSFLHLLLILWGFLPLLRSSFFFFSAAPNSSSSLFSGFLQQLAGIGILLDLFHRFPCETSLLIKRLPKELNRDFLRGQRRRRVFIHGCFRGGFWGG